MEAALTRSNHGAKRVFVTWLGGKHYGRAYQIDRIKLRTVLADTWAITLAHNLRSNLWLMVRKLGPAV